MTKRAKATPLIELLRRTTFGRVYGELTDYGVRPSVTKDQYLGRLRSGFHLPRLSNYRLERHFAGDDVIYFMGTPDPASPFTLAIIDVDVQKKRRLGSAAGAEAFARHLRRTRWPTLVWERSRGGAGLGCPVLIRKDGRTAAEVNAALKRLDRQLKAEAKRIGADIENVEVKGTLPVATYRDGSLDSIRYGQFARLPRTLTFEQLADAPVLSCEELLLAEVAEPVAESPARAAVPGSVSGRLVSDEELAAVPQYERLYRRMTGGDLKATARFVVTAHDFAVACVLLRVFKNNPNPDGSLPTSRVRAMWAALYNAGQVSRPFNDRRWKRIRDFLSEHGHVDWTDHRYQAPDPARGLRAVACKWEITDEFFALLESITQPQDSPSFVDTALVRQGPGRWLTPKLHAIQAERDREFWSRAEVQLEKLLAA